MNETVCFGFSITYFFILYKTDSATFRSISLIAYFGVLLGMIVSPILTNISLSKSKCASTTYGVFNRIASFIMIGIALLLLIASVVLYCQFRSNKKLPECLVKEDEPEEEQK